MKSKLKLGILLLIAIAGGLIFTYYGYSKFDIQENFTSIPLSFNPYDSTSEYNWNGTRVNIKGGFVKGIILDNDKVENLVLRSLSPEFSINLVGNQDENKTYKIMVENVSPVSVTVKGLKEDKQEVLTPQTLGLTLSLNHGEERTVEVSPSKDEKTTEFVILGDNRNGYQTFATIVDQINAINPIFVVNNGDLVFGGEPNKYRLFYESVSKLNVPLYTTLGNHDIRENGRGIYTKLFGPPYYSFDYEGNHFVFLDSSRGWSEKYAIPEKQYKWLENDLEKASGKRIFVISHVPPVDPRKDLIKNTFPNEPGVEKTDAFEKIMDVYYQYKRLDHGFPDSTEAKRFESIMTKYKVDTVFLSHIHSYFNYIKDDVRYVISGGAGAELLTEDSYYHYLKVKVHDKDNYLEMIQLPSPTNTLQDRFIAGFNLFATSMFKEYRTVIILIGALIAVILSWILYTTYQGWEKHLKFVISWFSDTVKFAVERFKKR